MEELEDAMLEAEALEAGADEEFVAESEDVAEDVPVEETDRNVVEPEGGPVEDAKTDASA